MRAAAQLCRVDKTGRMLPVYDNPMFCVVKNGIVEKMDSRQAVALDRGWRLTLEEGTAHQLSVLHSPGGDTYPGAMILEELSTPHNYATDTYFPGLECSDRTAIEEDQPSRYVLIGEYPFTEPDSCPWGPQNLSESSRLSEELTAKRATY